MVERLKALSISYYIDSFGNIRVHFSGNNAPDERPCLFFAFLGTSRWDPLKAWARLDSSHARGAGLSDAIPPAALISLAESLASGELVSERDSLLLFLAQSSSAPIASSFEALADTGSPLPLCALGLGAFKLGLLSPKGLGTWRLRIRIHCADGQSAVEQTVSLAQKLGGVRWDASGSTLCHIRSIRAGAGFSKPALDGYIDLELESSDPTTLDLVKEAVLATAKTTEQLPAVSVNYTELSFVPPGIQEVNAPLAEALRASFKELHIPLHELDQVDPAAWFSTRGVPGISVALAQGLEGSEEDVVDIVSLETGRKLLISVFTKMQTLMPPLVQGSPLSDGAVNTSAQAGAR